MSTGLDSLLSALCLDFIPEIRKLGFKGSGRNFRRIRGETINAVNFQGSSTGARFYMNLGLHFAFLPPGHEVRPITPEKFKEIDCEFRWRLHPQDNRKIDWIYGGSVEESASVARDVLQAYLAFGEPVFQRFPTASAIADAVTLAAAKSGTWNVMPVATTSDFRWFRTLARIHDHLGNEDLCREFESLAKQS